MENLDSINPFRLSLTFDLEWWGRAHLLAGKVAYPKGLSSDIAATYRVLESLSESQIKATFFVVAGDFDKGLIRAIHAGGHELASHSLTHPLFHHLSIQAWQKELGDSKKILEDWSGARVKGFRAPSWSIPYDRHEAFLDCLAEAGYQYDSSFCPFKTWLYGDARFPAQPQRYPNGITEIPLPKIGWPRAPWVGGFYARLLPYFWLKRFILQARPPFLYFHPWEFHTEPLPPLSLRNAWISKLGRKQHFCKASRLWQELHSQCEFVHLSDQDFGPIHYQLGPKQPERK